MRRRALQDASVNRGDIRLAIFPPLRQGLHEVLTGQPLVELAGQAVRSVEQAPERYAELADSVSPLATARAVPRDKVGDLVIAAAFAASAELVAKGDADMRNIGSFEGVGIVSAAETLRRMETRGRTRSWRAARPVQQAADALDYFLSGLQILGLLNNVALLTASDFSRTAGEQRRRLRPRLGQPPHSWLVARCAGARCTGVFQTWRRTCLSTTLRLC